MATKTSAVANAQGAKRSNNTYFWVNRYGYDRLTSSTPYESEKDARDFVSRFIEVMNLDKDTSYHYQQTNDREWIINKGTSIIRIETSGSFTLYLHDLWLVSAVDYTEEHPKLTKDFDCYLLTLFSLSNGTISEKEKKMDGFVKSYYTDKDFRKRIDKKVAKMANYTTPEEKLLNAIFA